MSEYLERIKQTFDEIIAENYSEKIWAKIYKKDDVSFRAKVKGVKSFIPFDEMPWSYQDLEHWNVVAKYLMGKVYDATLLGSNEETTRLTLSALNHNFPKKNYTKGQSYKCVVLLKHKTYLTVEAGIDSTFKNGSQIGEVSTYDLAKASDFRDAAVGDELVLTYLKHKNESTITLCSPTKYTRWYKQKPKQQVGSSLEVTVNKVNNKSTFTLLDGINGVLRISPKLYGSHLVTPLNNYINNLSDGDQITCLVHGTNPKTSEFFLRFEPRLLEELEKI